MRFDIGYQFLENVSQHVNVFGVTRHDVTKPVVKHSRLGRFAHVVQRDSTTEERIVTAKDVEGRDIDDDAGLVCELGDNTVATLQLERR